MKEIWKDIVGYENLYQVSNLGRVKSLKYSKERILKPYSDGAGYLTITLNCEKQIRIHRLVAETFLANPKHKSQVNHINGIKFDNRVNNLEFCTPSENQQHALKNKLRPTKEIIQCDLNGNAIKEWNCISECIRKTNISNIWNCLNGRQKTAGGYVWKYKDIE